jgi:hypothetical protein
MFKLFNQKIKGTKKQKKQKKTNETKEPAKKGPPKENSKT